MQIHVPLKKQSFCCDKNLLTKGASNPCLPCGTFRVQLWTVVFGCTPTQQLAAEGCWFWDSDCFAAYWAILRGSGVLASYFNTFSCLFSFDVVCRSEQTTRSFSVRSLVASWIVCYYGSISSLSNIQWHLGFAHVLTSSPHLHHT